MSRQRTATPEGKTSPPRDAPEWLLLPGTGHRLDFWREKGFPSGAPCGLTLHYRLVLRAIQRYREGSEADQLFWLEVVAWIIVGALRFIELAQCGCHIQVGKNESSTADKLAAEAIRRVQHLAFKQAERLLTDDWFHWGPCLRGLWYGVHVPALSPADLKDLAQIWREIAEAARTRRIAVEKEQPALHALLRIFTKASKEQIDRASDILRSNQTVNDKLLSLNALLQFPATITAPQLGEVLGVTAAAIKKTEWWQKYPNRRRKREDEATERRRARMINDGRFDERPHCDKDDGR